MVTYTSLEGTNYDVTNPMTYDDVGVYTSAYTDSYAGGDAAYRLSYTTQQVTSHDALQPAVVSPISTIGEYRMPKCIPVGFRVQITSTLRNDNSK